MEDAPAALARTGLRLRQRLHLSGREDDRRCQSATAYAIGRELRLSGDDRLDVLDYTPLENPAPEILKTLAERVPMFARVSPAH